MCNCCLSVKHVQSSNLLLTSKSNCEYNHSHYHCIICAALARLEVWGKGIKFFFYFSVIYFSLAFWLKGSMFAFDCRQKQFICKKTHPLEAILFCKAHQLLIQNMNSILAPKRAIFETWHLKWRPESLSFNHGSHSCWHGLNWRSNVAWRRSNFVPSAWCKVPESNSISWCEVKPGFLYGFLHFTPHILDSVHIRRSWWPMNESDIDLPR
jgi:hypothetical protein